MNNTHIGINTEIHPTAIIHDNTWIGDDVYVGPYAIIGAPPQHRGSYPAPLDGHKYNQGVRIGNGSCIREHVTIHAGILAPTEIGFHNLLMAYTHIGHDSTIGYNVTIATHGCLGGFTCIDDDVTFGQAVVTHPWVCIGHGSMVGMNSTVVRDVLPYQKVAGSPARLIGVNSHRAPDMTKWRPEDLSAQDWDEWNDNENWRHVMKQAWAAQ
jgi:UDP-N-acetylglucosamine acyltransferase